MVVLPVPTSPDKDDESLAGLHAVDQIRQRFFVLFAAVEERRIRA